MGEEDEVFFFFRKQSEDSECDAGSEPAVEVNSNAKDLHLGILNLTHLPLESRMKDLFSI